MTRWGTRGWFEREFDAVDDLSDPWGHEWRGSQSLRYERLAGLAAPLLHARSRLLDLGCAYGALTGRLSRRNLQGLSVGLDISVRAARVARGRLPAAVFAVGALPDCGLASNQFDVVVAAEVICYLPAEARGAAMATIRRLLRPGGYLAFSNVLDNGKRYFTPAGAQALIDSYLEIERVDYGYDRWYAGVENRLLDLERRSSRGRRILLDDSEYETWRREHAHSRKAQWVGSWRKIRPARNGLTLLFTVLRTCIRGVLSLKWPVRALARLSDAWGGESARSTIFIVAKKEGRVNDGNGRPD